MKTIQNIVNHPYISITLDKKGYVAFANQAGKRFLSDVGFSDFKIWEDKLSRLGTKISYIEFEQSLADKYYTFRITKQPDNTFLVFGNEVTQRKRHDQLLNLQRELVQLMALKKPFEEVILHLQNELLLLFPKGNALVYISDPSNSFLKLIDPSLQKPPIYPESIVISEAWLEELSASEKKGYWESFESNPSSLVFRLPIWRDEHIKAMLVVAEVDGKRIGPFEWNTLETLSHVVSLGLQLEKDRYKEQERQQKTEKNRKELASLVDHTNDYMLLVDNNLKVLAFNQQLQHDFSTPQQKIEIGELFSLPKDPSTSKRWRNFLVKALEGQKFVLETQLKMVGKTKNLEMIFTPVVENSPVEGVQVNGVSVLARDITDRKRTETALRESEANLNALLQNTNDLIFSVDLELCIIKANNAFKDFLRWQLKKPIDQGLSFFELQEDPNYELWLACFEEAKQEETFTKEFFYPATSLKKAIFLEVSFYPILNKLNNIISGVSVFARDITNRKLYEEELQQANFELDSFVYRASHDLRAPLRSILGLVDLMKMDSAKSVDYLNMIEKSVNRLDGFIHDLTNYSRNSRFEITTQPIDLEHIVNESLDNLLFLKINTEVITNFKMEEGVAFKSDPTRIGIIVNNLLSNSIKYSKNNGSPLELEISLKKTDSNMYELKFLDNGKGIAAEHLDKVFDMFYRANQDGYGSGLGLYIVKQTVKKLDGAITIQSKENHFTLVTILLPIIS